MASQDDGGFRLNVLNPGGRDPEQHFGPDALQRSASFQLAEPGQASWKLARREQPDPDAHAPVNFHAYAACTGGSFFRDADAAIASAQPVLLLLRGDFRDSEGALLDLKKAGLRVAVSLKETGLHQIAEQLCDPAKLRRLIRIVTTADGCIAPTPEAADIFRAIRRSEVGVAFIATPYPCDDARWDLSRPLEERRGVFVGTREWDVPSRNHFAALAMAREISAATDEVVTVFELGGRKGARLLDQLGFAPERLRILTRRTPYPEYLRTMAEHRIVLQLDTSFVPGQVAGDALLCRLPCVGGNGAVDRLAHPRTCGHGRSGKRILAVATELLSDDRAYEQAVADSQRAAAEYLSFAGIAGELAKFYDSLGASA